MNRFEFYKNLDEFKGTRSETFLQHYGILGQKWGTRRWQNPDGTFNTEGKIRYFGSKKAENEKIGRQMHDYKTGKEVNEMIDIKPDHAKIKTNIETSFNIPDKYKGYEKEITEQVSKMMIDSLKDVSADKMPKKIDVNITDDGRIRLDFGYDDQKIGNIYDTGFNLRRKMLNSKWDQVGRKQFADAIKRNRDMVDAKNLTDEEIDEIINNRMKSSSNETLISDFNTQSLRLQMEKALNTKFGNMEKLGGLFNKKAINENGEEYNPKYQNRDGSLTWDGRQLSEKKAAKKINSEMLEDYKNKKSEREAKENKVKEILNDARSDVKIKKELQNKDISDKELENIINDIDNYSSWKYWDELEKNNKNEFNKIADLGLDALARSSKYYSSDDDIGDDGWRDWFMYEDQTIGLPQITKLYYDGYSKDYINKMIDKVSSISYEDYDKKYGEDSSAKFFIDQTDWQNQNKKFVEALFDPDYNAKDQKIGSSPKEAKKLAKEAEKLEKELKNAKYQDEQKIINSLINDDKYKDTIDEAIKPYVEKNKKNIDRVNEIFKDYEDNEINTLANAGIVNSLINKWGDKNNNETMKELAGYAWFYLNDDGNQSDNTAEYLYATIDKGVKAKELGNLWDNLYYSNEEKKENISSLKKDPFLSNLSDDTLKKIVTNKFESKFDKGSYWNLYNASDTASDPDNTVKKAYNEAKNISKKLEKSCGNTNGWDYFWKAVDNLGMNDMNYKDLSQADWDRINAEINKLKK